MLQSPQETAAMKHKMKAIGLHIMQPEWASLCRKKFSTSFREVTLKIYGSSEELRVPVQTCTRVWNVKTALANKLTVPAEDLIFIKKQGCAWVTQSDIAEIASKTIVRGISSFQLVPHRWPHPTAVLGAGYNGIKTALWWLHDRDTNFVIFDRNDRVGGYCWIWAANKTSKLQTELAAFNVGFGHEFNDGRCGSIPVGLDAWPSKQKVLEHFQGVAEDHGILPHCRFQVSVNSMDILGKQGDELAYQLNVQPLHSDVEESYSFQCSYLLHFPGAMTGNRIIEFPGEDAFGGHIGYGMNDDIPYEHLRGMSTAILGNGAFAVENVRTCCEYGANKVYIITRRKNLPCPRLACWFVHQAVVAVPGSLLLSIFEPMFEAAGMGDPWKYWAVHGTRATRSVTISQGSRFGIGDVAFLAHACGKLEYIEDELKRLSHLTLHFKGGGKLAGVTNLIKALGLTGDFEVDRLHRMTKMVGWWCSGDFKRPIMIDAVGMHAANFETMSTGMGSYHNVALFRFFCKHPKEWYRMEMMGIQNFLPERKQDNGRPCYLFDVRYATSTGIAIGGMCRRSSEIGPTMSSYLSEATLKACPLGEFTRTCRREWDMYQQSWKEMGLDHPYVPYPYTDEMVEWWSKAHRTAIARASEDAAPAEAFDSSYLEASHEFWASECGQPGGIGYRGSGVRNLSAPPH